MMTGSVAMGAILTIWNRAAKEPDLLKRYATATLGSATVGLVRLFVTEYLLGAATARGKGPGA